MGSTTARSLLEACALNLPLVLAKRGNFEAALACADDARLWNPDSVKALYRKAQALSGLRRFGAAELAARMGSQADVDLSTKKEFSRLLQEIEKARQQSMRPGGMGPADNLGAQ